MYLALLLLVGAYYQWLLSVNDINWISINYYHDQKKLENFHHSHATIKVTWKSRSLDCFANNFQQEAMKILTFCYISICLVLGGASALNSKCESPASSTTATNTSFSISNELKNGTEKLNQSITYSNTKKVDNWYHKIFFLLQSLTRSWLNLKLKSKIFRGN